MGVYTSIDPDFYSIVVIEPTRNSPGAFMSQQAFEQLQKIEIPDDFFVRETYVPAVKKRRHKQKGRNRHTWG